MNRIDALLEATKEARRLYDDAVSRFMVHGTIGMDEFYLAGVAYNKAVREAQQQYLQRVYADEWDVSA